MTAPTPAGVNSKPVNHRLGDEWLMAYAAGALSEGQSLIVASHLSYLEDAPARVSLAEAAGGALLERLEADRMSPDALARTLALLDAEETGAAVPPQPRRNAGTGNPLPLPCATGLAAMSMT